ncbi:adenosine deaminase [Actinobaculum suis]|uniref:adenosine deaminase n=1 Tax=Actinobaculum suis TaxID=1657 RepID=UPI0009F2576E|nr:adenosine deaminase [Actinobaculum suis]
MRDLHFLPKTHLHLHFTGSMSVPTLASMAREQGRRLPENLTDNVALHVPADQRGWFRFQRSYDAARAVVRSEASMRRIVREAAAADAAEGSRRLEIQIDPTSYAPFVGGITPALEIVLDEAKKAQASTGVEVGVIVAASRIRHPLDARTLARLAARYAGDGPGEVIGFGLSNDERRGNVADWGPAFRIAARAGLKSVPHSGELRGPRAIRETIEYLHPDRLGHGVRAAEDPALLEQIVAAGISLEVCPASNISLGVYPEEEAVPLRTLYDAGAEIALGADDPLLFLSRLTDQYEMARRLGFSDPELAELARRSIRASFASENSKRTWLAEVDDWLETPPNTKPAKYLAYRGLNPPKDTPTAAPKTSSTRRPD